MRYIAFSDPRLGCETCLFIFNRFKETSFMDKTRVFRLSKKKWQSFYDSRGVILGLSGPNTHIGSCHVILRCTSHHFLGLLMGNVISLFGLPFQHSLQCLAVIAKILKISIHYRDILIAWVCTALMLHFVMYGFKSSLSPKNQG